MLHRLKILLLLWLPNHALLATEEPPLIVVGMQPYAQFVERIGADVVRVETLLPTNSDPHHFALNPSQMKLVEDAAVVLIGAMPFEQTIFQRKLASAEASKTILLEDDHAHDHHHAHHHHHEHCLAGDAHSWLNIDHAIEVSEKVGRALSAQFPEHRETILENTHAWISELEALHSEIYQKLAPLSGKKVLVYHPAWGSFLNAFGIEQIAVEKEGKPLSAKHMSTIKKQIDETYLSCILVHPQADDRLITKLNTFFNLPVKTSNPLPHDYSEELRNLSILLIQASNGK